MSINAGRGSYRVMAASAAVVVLTVAGAVSALLAQNAPPAAPAPQAADAAAGPWLGLPLPGPATGNIIDFSKGELPAIPPPDAKAAPELEGRKATQYIRDVVAFSYASRDAGDKTWGRLAGTRWAEATVDYVAKHFRDAGLQDVRKETVPFTAPMTIATDWKVTVLAVPELGVGSRDIQLQSAYPMGVRAGGAGPRAGGRGAQPAGAGGPAAPVTPPPTSWSVTAPVVFVGAGTPADLVGRDLRGKIAIVQSEPAPASFFGTAGGSSQRLQQAGAVGVLATYSAPGNMQLFAGGCSNAPCFNLGGEDGEFLNALLARASAANVLDKIRISLSLTHGTIGGPGHVVVGKVAGVSSAENLVVSAHSDAWFAGANDNASGVAALIALARHYAKGPKPRHDMYFFLSPGHHSPTGGMRRLVELYPNVAPSNIMAINLEHIAQQNTYKSYFSSRGMGRATSKYGNAYAETLPVNWESPGRELSGGPMTQTYLRVLQDAAKRTHYTAVNRISPYPVAEPQAFVDAGGTAIQDVETSIWFHTSGDTPEAISEAGMQRAMFFYKDILDQSDKLTRAQMRAGAAPAAPRRGGGGGDGDGS